LTVILTKPKKRQIDRNGSYVILIADRNFKSLKVEMTGIAEAGELNFTIFWNSEARFVVAVAYEFSISQQTLMLYFFAHYRI
jgi:hypothetical protein